MDVASSTSSGYVESHTEFAPLAMDVASSTSSEYVESHTGFVETVNDFFQKYGLDPIWDLKDITAATLVTVFEVILGDRLEGVIKNAVTREDEVHNIQCLIDSLASDFLHCDLSHITGVAIVDGHVTSLQYLLEIFLELESFLMEQISVDSSSHPDAPKDKDLDAHTRGTVNAISDVLREEGIGSPPINVGDSIRLTLTKDGDTDTSIRSFESRLPSSISGDLEQHQLDISDLSIEELIKLGDRAVYGRSHPYDVLPSSTSGPLNVDQGRVRRALNNDVIPSQDDTDAKTFVDQIPQRDPVTSMARDHSVYGGNIPSSTHSQLLETGFDPRRDPQTSRHMRPSQDLDLLKQHKAPGRSNDPHLASHRSRPSRDDSEAMTLHSLRDRRPQRNPVASRDHNIPTSTDSQSLVGQHGFEAGFDPRRDPQTSRHMHPPGDLDPFKQQNANNKYPGRSKDPQTSSHRSQCTKFDQNPDKPRASLQKKPESTKAGVLESKDRQSNLRQPLDSYLSVSSSSKPSVSQSMNSTSSTISSAAWPEPPSSRDGYEMETELASLGTGVKVTAKQQSGRVSGSEKPGFTQRHTHTHHHYHQPVLFDADKVGRKQALATSLPSAPPRPPSDRTIPSLRSSAMVPPAGCSSSLPSSPKHVQKDYPSREAFITLPGRQPPRDHPMRKSRQENIPSGLDARKLAKSRSWDDDNVERSERTAEERSLHKETHPKCRSYESEETRERGPSKSKTKLPLRQERKVAFLLEDREDKDVRRLAELAALAKLRARVSSSDEDSDSDVSVHSDSIIDYQRSFREDIPERKTRRLRRRTPKALVSGSLLHGRSPPRVTFEDTLDAQAKGTMGKIRRKIGKEKKHQDIERKTLQFLYSAGLRELHSEMGEQESKRKRLVKKQDQEYKRKVLRKPKTSINHPAGKYSAKLIPQAAPGRSGRGQRSKRKRSPSPRFSRQKRLTVGDDEVLPVLLSEFPFLHVSPETAHSMWTKQLRQVEQLTKVGIEHTKQNKMQKKIEDAERRQKLLMDIMKKELAHNQRMRELQDKREKKTILQRKEREKRQVTARARRYYNEFRVQAQSRMSKQRTKEEKIFRNLFDDALKIQKSRITDLRKYARDKREEMAEQEQCEIESMENYYRDRFHLLAETLENEKYELSVRDNAQARVLDQMRRAMRRKMEDEIRDFQDQLYRDEDAAHFRQLEADRLKQRLRNAAYKTQL